MQPQNNSMQQQPQQQLFYNNSGLNNHMVIKNFDDGSDLSKIICEFNFNFIFSDLSSPSAPGAASNEFNES